MPAVYIYDGGRALQWQKNDRRIYACLCSCGDVLLVEGVSQGHKGADILG